MSNFITNSTHSSLESRINALIKSSSELKFLVSFFYFSGMAELYEGLRNNPDVILKILVGLNIDTLNYDVVEVAGREDMSDDAIARRFCEDTRTSLSSERHDTQQFYRQAQFIIEMIRLGRLIIRKTYEPNHAKLYLFQLNESQVARNSVFITGSSNLTAAGLSTQREFNVEISDYGYKEAVAYFDGLWANAVEITECDTNKQALLRTVTEQTHIKEITPFAAYCVALKSYLDSFETKEIGDLVLQILQDKGYRTYRYQLDAMKQALAIIEKNNGVIIADVVGLGKTVIACAIAKQLHAARGLILCPPGIMGDENALSGWSKYKEEFGLRDWEIRSQGALEQTLEWVNGAARDTEVVIIDEAHRFRNQDTKNYELLKNICRNKRVILLTATPFNNNPGDILALLALFITPKKSTITLEADVAEQFASYTYLLKRLDYIRKYRDSHQAAKRTMARSYYKKIFGAGAIDPKRITARAGACARQIRGTIEPITIRRNRLDLQRNPHYKNEVTELPTVADPQEWFFELEPNQLDFYTRVLEHYFASPDNGGRFKGALYRPYEYETGVLYQPELEFEDETAPLPNREQNRQYLQQRNLFDFMRRLLVKRFESSFGAFAKSIANFRRVARSCQRFIEKTGEYILDRTLIEKNIRIRYG